MLRKLIILFTLIFLVSNFSYACDVRLGLETPSKEKSKVILLKNMFQAVTIEKNADAIKQYYHPEFLLHTNGITMDFQTFLKKHEKFYKTPIEYTIKYDDDAFIESDDKVAARVFITTKMPNEKADEVEVALIARYKDDQLYRLWEVTFPDWQNIKALKAGS